MKNKINYLCASVALTLLCVYFASSAARMSGAVETAFIGLWVCLFAALGLSVRQQFRQHARQDIRALRRRAGHPDGRSQRFHRRAPLNEPATL